MFGIFFGPQFFLGYSFDVKIRDLSIYEVFRAFPALLHGFWEDVRVVFASGLLDARSFLAKTFVDQIHDWPREAEERNPSERKICV